MSTGPTRKPQPDVYTLMLLLALLAIIAATVFLYLETKDYGSPPYQGGPSVSARHSTPWIARALPAAARPEIALAGDPASFA